MASSSHKNFRLRGIPLEYETRAAVRGLIQQTLSLEPSASLTVYSLAISPVDQKSKIATLSFPSIPAPLSDRTRDEWVFHISDDNDDGFSRSLVFDVHFAGFTPFQRTSDDDCHVDMIAVCGLGGHALGSFKEKNGPFVWLRDALPLDVPNVRIMTYGYDTKLIKSTSFQSLTDLGRALQLDLEGIRDPTRTRPIIFIGHSLGGLVIKETVLKLKEEPLGNDSAILNAISGFAFFGVPHQGLTVECLVPLVKDSPNRALVESLNKNSALLERLQKEFEKVLRTKRRSVVCFYETERSPTAVELQDGKWEMSGPSEVLVEVPSATCGSQKQHPINRNHSEMVKYSSAHDQLYTRVMIALRPVLNITRGWSGTGASGRGNKVCFPLSDDQKDCLRSLSFPEQEHRYSEISYKKDTCEWLLEESQYQRWMNEPRGLFWIKGSPGTGKSVLTKFAVDTMERRKSSELVVSFFSHGRGVALQRTPLGMFRSLLNSLLRAFPTYLCDLTEQFMDQQQRYGSYEQPGGWRWKEEELEKFLSKLLTEGTKEQPVVIFVDALDECGEGDAKRLLAYFKDIMEDAYCGGSLVRICFSSRHFPILGHETMSRVYVEEKNSKDIRLVIEDRLKDIRPKEKRRQLENEILLKVHGGFQWAMLITSLIRDEDATGARTKNLLKMVSTIPEDLNELYDVLLRGASKEKLEQMTKLFQWVLFAKRPLCAQELREALATDKDMTCATIAELRSHGDWSDTIAQFEIRVRHISRGLVEFQTRDVWEQYEPGGEEWNREAQFIHQSAADFVAQQFLRRVKDESTSRSFAFTGHFEISRSFLKYLTLDEVLNGGNLSRDKLSAIFPLMPYGIASVLYHIAAVEQEGTPQTDLTTLIQWGQQGRLEMLARVWRIMDPESTHAPRGWPFVGATVLHLVISFGSASLLDTLLQKDDSDLNAKDSEGNTPLQLAIRENRQDLAIMILDRSKLWQSEQEAFDRESLPNESNSQRKDYLEHIEVINDDDETCLGLALSVRADRIIQSLIDAGAQVKCEKPLVFYAISTEDRKLLSRLINEDADLEGAVFFAIQCLRKPNPDDTILLKLLSDLLKAGAGTSRFTGVEGRYYDEMDEQDEEWYEESITLASRDGRTEVVSLLLSHGSSPLVEDAYGQTPLVEAFENRHLETAKALLQASPKSVIEHCDGGDVLFYEAVERGWFDFAQLFIDAGDTGYISELLIPRAIENNALYFVKSYIQADNNLIGLANVGDDYDADPPFLEAMRKGYHEMVELLLSTGKIDISIKDESGNTPFGLAVQTGNTRIANLLLDTGKVVVENGRDRDRLFEWALMNGDEEIAKLLLDTGKIDNCVKGGYGDTPFWLAILNGKRGIAKLLLDTGNVDIADERDGYKPFEWALMNGDEKIAKLLLDTGKIDVNRRIEGHALLWWTIHKGYFQVMESLLAMDDTDVSQENDEGQTPLWFALESRNLKLVMLLVTSGRFDMHTRDKDGRTLLLWALENGQDSVIELVLDSGKFKAEREDVRSIRRTFWWALESGCYSIAKALIDSGGLGANTGNNDAVCKMFWGAVKRGDTRVIIMLHDSSTFDINTKDQSGRTPLILAAANGDEAAVRLLLETGKVEVHAADGQGDTALSIAVQRGFQSISDLLSAYMDWNVNIPIRLEWR